MLYSEKINNCDVFDILKLSTLNNVKSRRLKIGINKKNCFYYFGCK